MTGRVGSNADTLLQQTVAATVDATGPEQVILFVLRVRGDAKMNSEIDYWRNSLNNVPARVLREGKSLHERP